MQPLQQPRGRFFRETRGQSIRIQGREVTPIGRVTQVTWPGGGILVHRPLAVEVRQGDTTQRYPLPNPARHTLGLPLLSLVLVALALGVSRWRVLERSAS